MTPAEFLERIDAAYRELSRHESLFQDDLVTELNNYPDDWELFVHEQWDLFQTVSREFAMFDSTSPDNELFAHFLHVLLAPSAPEEEFYDRSEFLIAMEGASFPDGFFALLEHADECYTVEWEYPPKHVAMWSQDNGWALAYPDKLVEFPTPFSLIKYLKSQLS